MRSASGAPISSPAPGDAVEPGRTPRALDPRRARYHGARIAQSVGLSRDISSVFVEAILLWRNAVQTASADMDNIAPLLIARAQPRRARRQP
jgi:hypothetical protein